MFDQKLRFCSNKQFTPCLKKLISTASLAFLVEDLREILPLNHEFEIVNGLDITLFATFMRFELQILDVYTIFSLRL